MKREILCIDFTIFVHEYVNFISDKVKEFDYSLRDSNLDLPFDLGLYNNIFNETFFKEAILKDKVVFTYRQEDILSYLQEGDTVYNVDFFSDEEEYNFLVTNKS